jgi:protein SHQ1
LGAFGSLNADARSDVHDVLAPAVPTGSEPQQQPVEEVRGASEPVEVVVRPKGRGQLATPKAKLIVELTPDEVDTLARVPPKKQTLELVAVHEGKAMCLLADLLLAYVYDQVVTAGDGCSESLWNVTTVSSALSWLDVFAAEDDCVVAFCRRVLTYPFYRSFSLALRCVRDAGTIMLSGRSAVLKALARVKSLLDHSEGKHVLSTVYLNPLIAHLQSMPAARCNAMLEQAAMRLHDCTVPAARRVAPAPSFQSVSAAALIGGAARKVRPHGLTVLDLGLPIS